MRPVTSPSTVDADEIQRFSAIAAEWWDPRGQFRPLHQMNPTRLRFIRDTLADQLHGSADRSAPLAGVRVLDVGCGGGLVAEPLARLGAKVTGIDASLETTRVAALHAELGGLAIDYRATSVDDLSLTGEQFDAVLALEIVEHVADLELFLRICGTLVSPGGVLILSTLNRTLRSLLLGKLAAEYILRWIPRGTHDWRRFVTPGELRAGLERLGFRVSAETGMTYSAFTDEWVLSRDLSMNYMLAAVRTGPESPRAIADHSPAPEPGM